MDGGMIMWLSQHRSVSLALPTDSRIFIRRSSMAFLLSE